MTMFLFKHCPLEDLLNLQVTTNQSGANIGRLGRYLVNVALLSQMHVVSSIYIVSIFTNESYAGHGVFKSVRNREVSSRAKKKVALNALLNRYLM